jgi:hypothetical protein
MKRNNFKSICLALVVSGIGVGCNPRHSKHDADNKVHQLPPPFKSERIHRNATILLAGSIDKVFPLFEPEPEKLWAEGWDFETLYPPSGKAEDHMIFQTLSPDSKGNKSQWVITKYDTLGRFIEYTIYNPDYITILDIVCVKESYKTTRATISYTYSGLTKHGNETIPMLLRNMYQEDMKDWEAALNYYLTNGKLLEHHR